MEAFALSGAEYRLIPKKKPLKKWIGVQKNQAISISGLGCSIKTLVANCLPNVDL